VSSSYLPTLRDLIHRHTILSTCSRGGFTHPPAISTNHHRRFQHSNHGDHPTSHSSMDLPPIGTSTRGVHPRNEHFYMIMYG
jgi:hypothetical protein